MMVCVALKIAHSARLFRLLKLFAKPKLTTAANFFTYRVKVNGFACKDAAKITPDDFFFVGLAISASTNNTMGTKGTLADVDTLPGLNTLGLSMVRVDYAPGGVIPPHTHPRGSEMLFVLYGELDVGFLTTSNKLMSKHLSAGDTFVFPKGLIHFQKNNGIKPAVAISAFNSQLPGAQSIPSALFTSSPPVPNNVLAMTFQVGIEDVEKIRANLSPKK